MPSFEDAGIAPAPAALAVAGEEHAHKEATRTHTLGNIRLRHQETDEIILVPTPSQDPNDPLNWPQWYKYYITAVVCLAVMMCNFLAAGPTIAMVKTTLSFFPDATRLTDYSAFKRHISYVAYFFTSTALMQGLGSFVWVPLTNKYGRRPVYVLSYTIYTACAIWLVFESRYTGFLLGRIVMGFGAGAVEAIAPLTIADMFFLHERGTIMSFYTAFMSVGVALGLVISGLITINYEWRTIYEVAAALIGLALLLIFFTFPETAYLRDTHATIESTTVTTRGKTETGEPASERPAAATSSKTTYIASLRIFTDMYTQESLVRLIIRPFGLILLPPVLWAALVQAVTIGFLVAMTSNVDAAFSDAYDFESWQSGLCYISAVLGSLLSIPAGGHFGDMVANWFTKRNGGIRDPEMRLPAIIPSVITTPLALVLYGVGVEQRLHWICPTIGLGLLNFSIGQATNIAFVYVIDSYRPVAGEVTVAVLGFKSLFGFLLSFYTNPWVDAVGCQTAYGTMGGIAAGVLLLWIPLFVWGKRIRHATLEWPIMSYFYWSEDREVGE